MLDRRRHPRALLADVLDGTLRLTEDVIVESYATNEITVVSGVPARADQCLAIAPVGAAPPVPLNVRVTESTPAVVNGVLRHRLRLRVNDQAPPGGPRMLGALVRDVAVRVLDMSDGGCLLETNVPVAHGTAAELQVPVDGEVHSDRLRVCRCSLVRGAGSVFRVGVEFAPASNGTSLRALLHRVLERGPVEARAIGP